MRSLNPGVKLAALIVASLLLSVTFNTRVNLAVAALALVATLCSRGCNRRGLALAMLPFAVTALAMFVTGLMYGASGNASTGVEADVLASARCSRATGPRPPSSRAACSPMAALAWRLPSRAMRSSWS